MSILARMLPVVSPWLTMDPSTTDMLTSRVMSDDRHLLLFAPQKMGKTSLLFQTAVSFAGEDKTVMCVSPQPLSKLPLTVHGLPHPTAAVLQAVKFVYYSTVKELIEFCAHIHTKSYFPDVIIIDDVDFYLLQMMKEGIDYGFAKLCALLVDAAKFISKKSESGKCQILMSSSDKHKSLPPICKQFNIAPLSIKGSLQNNQYELTYETTDHHTVISTYNILGADIRLNSVALVTPI